MSIVLLVRHGRTTANADGILAGRLPGIHLDEVGRTQVAACGDRLAGVTLTRIVTSELDRCRETAEAVATRQAETPATEIEPGLVECDYGQWQGRPLKDLAGEPLWATVQRHPSAAAFPGGESLAAMASRAVDAVRRWDTRITTEHGPHAVWAAVAHGDIIKAILADALGMHLDLFQRLHVDPASVSIVGYGDHRPDVMAVNTVAGDCSWLNRTQTGDDATVGGGSGHGADVAPRS